MDLYKNEENDKIGLITVNYNDWETTANFIKKIKHYNSIDKIIVVDNQSTDHSFYELKKLEEKNHIDVIQSDRNGGYGYGNNYGIRYAADKYGIEELIISNPDVSFDESVINKMVNVLKEKKNAGVVAPLMKTVFGKTEKNTAWKVPMSKWSFLFFDAPILNRFLQKKYLYIKQIKEKKRLIRVGAVAGSFLMVRASAFLDVGGYDEKMFLYYEETVLGIKMKKYGKYTYLLTDCDFIHVHGASIRKSIKSGYSKTKIVWTSKLFVFKNYYGATRLDVLFFNMVKWPCLIYSSLRMHYAGKTDDII